MLSASPLKSAEKCADSELSVWKSTWHVSHGVCRLRNTCRRVLQLWKSLPCDSDSFGLTLGL